MLQPGGEFAHFQPPRPHLSTLRLDWPHTGPETIEDMFCPHVFLCLSASWLPQSEHVLYTVPSPQGSRLSPNLTAKSQWTKTVSRNNQSSYELSQVSVALRV